MKHIDENRINELLSAGKRTDIVPILEKSLKLQRLSLAETAALLAVDDPEQMKKIFEAASYVKNEIYGKRVVLFAPLYISNICGNNCLYCAFRTGNKEIERKALTPEEIKDQTEYLLKRGHKRILMVAGEAPPKGKKLIDYYVESIKAIYAARSGINKIRRVNINCAPLSVEEFRELKKAGIGTYQIFQETYHEATYRKMHVGGPKSDPDNRLDAVDRAFTAGIDDLGIGVLYGLYDHRFETLALLMHIEHLEKKFKVGPHTISVPRIEPADGSEVSKKPPHELTDDEFKKVVAVLRLAVPYTGIILSTRETAEMRDNLFNLGVSQVSAESNTTPGGYSNEEDNAQFAVSDTRTLDEVIGSLIEHGHIPSFCAACYRKERTGEKFMDLAKPGTIKGKCSMNALITLKEYLDDYASDKVRKDGYKMIEQMKSCLSDKEKAQLNLFFEDINKGIRDAYV